MSSAAPTAPATKKQSLLAHFLLVAVALVWGSTFALVKAALRDASPLCFTLFRMSLAAALLLAVNLQTLRGLRAKQIRLCALAGLLLALGYALQTVGLATTTPSKSAFLTGLVVVLVPLFSGLLSAFPGMRTRATPRPGTAAYGGALVAFAGIVLLTSEPGTGVALLAGIHRGEWLTLGCAIAFAFHLLTLARGAGEVPPRVLGTLQIAFAAIVMLVLLPLGGRPTLHWTPTLILALAVTSVLATAAAFTIQSWAQGHLPASHTALIFTLEPVFAALTSLMFFGEHLGSRAVFGAVLILLGILLAELGPTTVSEAALLSMEP